MKNYYYSTADDGYKPSRVLLSPVNNPDPAPGSPASRYNDAYAKPSECGFGPVKALLRAANGERGLHYAPEKAGRIITSVFVMYNFKRRRG